MATLHLLGTGGAVTSPDRTTTMLAITAANRTLVVDCGGDLVHRMLQHRLHVVGMDALFITHEHPDHVAGFPLFMEKIWLMGRTAPLPVFGIPEALDQAKRCLGAFRTDSWDLPPIEWNELPLRPHEPVCIGGVFNVRTAPGVHGVPVTGIDIRIAGSESRMTYSCDTEPCPDIVELARGTDLLVHEANGAGRGHSSVLQAASVAHESGAGRLVLVHLPASVDSAELATAQSVFPATTPGRDGMTIDF